MRRSIIGQDAMIERLLIGLLANGHLLVEGLPGLAKTRAVKRLAKDLDAGLRASSSRPISCPRTSPAPRSTTRPKAGRPSFDSSGADLRQPDPRRRDQPRAGQGASGAARSHGGAAGDGRRHDAPAARPVPGDGHAEPDRAGRHLPAARGADGPLPDEGPSAIRTRRPRSRSSSWCAARRCRRPRRRRRRLAARLAAGRLEARAEVQRRRRRRRGRDVHRRARVRHALPRTSRRRPPPAGSRWARARAAHSRSIAAPARTRGSMGAIT